MEPWLVNVLVQFPVVVVIGLVVWYAYGQVKANSDAHLRREDERTRADADRVNGLFRDVVAAQDREIARQDERWKELTAEVRKLRSSVDALARKLDRRTGGRE